jgi:glutamate synthase domain-containing protein 2
MFVAWKRELIRILKRLGMKRIGELVGQTDCLVHLDYLNESAEVFKARQSRN